MYLNLSSCTFDKLIDTDRYLTYLLQVKVSVKQR